MVLLYRDALTYVAMVLIRRGCIMYRGVDMCWGNASDGWLHAIG